MASRDARCTRPHGPRGIFRADWTVPGARLRGVDNRLAARREFAERGRARGKPRPAPLPARRGRGVSVARGRGSLGRRSWRRLVGLVFSRPRLRGPWPSSSPRPPPLPASRSRRLPRAGPPPPRRAKGAARRLCSRAQPRSGRSVPPQVNAGERGGPSSPVPARAPRAPSPPSPPEPALRLSVLAFLRWGFGKERPKLSKALRWPRGPRASPQAAGKGSRTFGMGPLRVCLAGRCVQSGGGTKPGPGRQDEC